MGHVHTPSKNANCYYCGSFERLSHGEEENKGFLTLTYNEETDNWFVKRIWNLDTTPFFTIYLSDTKSYEENCKILISEVEKNLYLDYGVIYVSNVMILICVRDWNLLQ